MINPITWNKKRILKVATAIAATGGLAYIIGNLNREPQIYDENLALAQMRSDSLRYYKGERIKLKARTDSLSGVLVGLESELGSLRAAPSRVDTVYRTQTVRTPGTRTPSRAELEGARRVAAEAERDYLFFQLPEGSRNFDYTRMETPEEIRFTSNPRSLTPDQYGLAVTETQQLGEYTGELRATGRISPETIQRFTTGSLDIYVARNTLNGGGILGVRVMEKK